MTMRYLFLTIFSLALLSGAFPAHALDALFVQGLAVRPYEEVYHGFRAGFSGEVKRIILAEGESDPVQAVRETRPDVIVAVGTEALSRLREIEEIPIVYAMVLQPEPLVSNRGNVTGVAMTIAAERQLGLFREVVPNAVRRIGVIYNPARLGEYVAHAREAAAAEGLELVTREVADPAGVAQALESLKGKVEGLWLLPDQTVAGAGAAEKILDFAVTGKLPVLAFSGKYLKGGALLSLDLDTRGVGRQVAELAASTAPGAEAPEVSEPRDVVPKISRSAVQRMGMNLNMQQLDDLRVAIVD